MADNWYPGKNAWEWTKKTAKDHPRLTGAVAGIGVVGAVIGSGGLLTVPGIIIGATAAGAGSGIGSSIAQDAKDKAEREAPKEDKKSG